MDYLANDVENLALYIRNTKCPPKTSKVIEEKKKRLFKYIYCSL